MPPTSIPVLDVSGDGRTRGRSHGEAFRTLIHEHLERWRAQQLRGTGLDVAASLQRLFAETDVLPAIRRWTPDLLEEVRGVVTLGCLIKELTAAPSLRLAPGPPCRTPLTTLGLTAGDGALKT